MQQDETPISFVLRFSFYTIKRSEHTGSNFDTIQIIEDVRKAITRYQIELVNHVAKPIYDDDKTKIARHKMYLDFRIRIASKQIDFFEDKNRGFLSTFGKNEPEQYFMKKYISLLNEILEEISGIDYIPASCNPYELIYCEGRVDIISK
ncbi:MAG: hypothetical protein KGI27_04995 [Thaumarchaeota archaeon]|nr:hypothetical protein [Nitrososphaerota archaeon]